MNLNQIEKQLTDKSVREIKECATEMVRVLKEFQLEKAGFPRKGIHWATNRDYSAQKGIYTYGYNHLDYDELERLIAISISHDSLDNIVRYKTKILLSKMELIK